jgi:protein-disulfide isomerase
MSEPYLEKILNEDKGVRFIYKNFPVLGPASTAAAKASFAALRQGPDKFVKFHEALMGKKEHLNDDIVDQTAKDAGLDIERLKKDVGDDAIQKQVQAGLDLGTEIGVRGTPFFIVGGKVYPGAMEYEQFKKAIADARAPAKKN